MWVKKTAQATQKSAEAAQLNARAVINLELPRIFHHVSLTPDEKGLIKSSLVQIEIWNYGRTPVQLTQTCMDLSVENDLPAKPIYKNIWHLMQGPLIREDHPHMWAIPCDTVLTDGIIRSIRDGSTQFWAYGYFVYYDFMGIDHTTGFCARWNEKMPPFSRFVPCLDHPNYIYHR